jgi:chromosome segregation ATPase
MSKVANYPYWLGWPNELFKPKRLRMVEMTDAKAPMTQADYLRGCIAWIDDPEMREIAKWHINDAADEFESLLAPSPPAPEEEEELVANLLAVDEERQNSSPWTVEEICKRAATALASAHRRAEEAEQAASVEATERRRSHARIAELEKTVSNLLDADDARAKYRKLILSANGYGPALAQQDRRIEELESKCERLISSCERTESERDEAKRARDAATAEAARLREKLKDISTWLAAYAYGKDLEDYRSILESDRFKSARAALAPVPSKEGDGE